MGKRTLKGAWIAFSLLPVDIFRYFGQILDILGKLPFLGKARKNQTFWQMAHRHELSNSRGCMHGTTTRNVERPDHSPVRILPFFFASMITKEAKDEERRSRKGRCGCW